MKHIILIIISFILSCGIARQHAPESKYHTFERIAIPLDFQLNLYDIDKPILSTTQIRNDEIKHDSVFIRFHKRFVLFIADNQVIHTGTWKANNRDFESDGGLIKVDYNSVIVLDSLNNVKVIYTQ